MVKFLKSALFCALFVVLMTFSSCSKSTNDVIPDVHVDFTIDLENPEFTGLSMVGNFDTIDARTDNWGVNAAGFDGNGIIVYCGPDEYYAYDRTCPHDYATNGKSVKVRVNFATAVCPVCGTTYTLSAFGTPVSGPGKYPLKNYMTSVENNRYLRVWNK